MKRLIALITAVLMLLSVTAGLAEDTAADAGASAPYVPARSGYYSPNAGPTRIEQSERKGYLEYEASYSGGKLQELEVELENSKTDEEYEVLYDSKGNIVRAEYETSDHQIYYDGKTWTDEKGNTVPGPDLAFVKKYYNRFYPHGQSYLNNTMGLVGVSLRDQYPGLTDKWYNIVPVDLTKDGSWSYPMAVSNKYYMGNCVVTVKDGNVTVDYTIPYGRFYVREQCMAWFTDVKDIDANFLNNPTSDFRFGQPVSISGDLKGQDTAILFICNHVDYAVPLRKDGRRPSRVLRGNPDLRKTVAGYVDMLEKMGR